jgi:hypothetical protein
MKVTLEEETGRCCLICDRCSMESVACDSERELRRDTKLAGWVRRKHNGGPVDLCRLCEPCCIVGSVE